MTPSLTAKAAADTAPASANTFVARLGLGLYLLFIASWFLQLGRRVPALGAIRFDLLLVIAISAICPLCAGDRLDAQRGWTARRFVFLLLGYAVVTLPLVEWPGSVLKAGLPEFFKAVVFCLFTGTLVKDRRGLAYLLMVFVGCQVFRVLEPLYLHVTQGYWGSQASMGNWEYLPRLAGAPYDIVNPNGLAFVIVTALAFCHFLCPLSKIGRLAYLGFLPLALWALALTASRTGILALAIVVAAIWWKSRRKVLIGAVVLVTVIGAAPFMSDDLSDRYLSMFSSDTKNAATVSERGEGLRAGIEVAMRRPLFGHGLGASLEANANFGYDDQKAHNLYVEIAEELGFLGLPIFLALMVALTRELAKARAMCRALGMTGLVARGSDALQVFLIMNLAFSLASYGVSGYEWYLMVGLCDVLTRLTLQARDAGQVSALSGASPAAAAHNLRTPIRPPFLNRPHVVVPAAARARGRGLV